MIVAVTRSRTVVAALCVVSVLALGACSGDDPQPKLAPPSSASSSAPTSPSTTAVAGPVEPTLPAAARGTDAAAAEAFVEFYWEMVNYAQQTGDVDGLRSLADATCAACREGTSYLERVFGDGGEISGGEATVRVRTSGFVNDAGRSNAVVVFDVSSTRQTVDYPGNRRDESYPGGVTRLNAILVPTSGGWLMSSWDDE